MDMILLLKVTWLFIYFLIIAIGVDNRNKASYMNTVKRVLIVFLLKCTSIQMVSCARTNINNFFIFRVCYGEPVHLKQPKDSKCRQNLNDVGKTGVSYFWKHYYRWDTTTDWKRFTETSGCRTTKIIIHFFFERRLEQLSCNLPVELHVNKHGTHKRCYQLFTNWSHVPKSVHSTIDDEDNQPSTSKHRRISSSSCLSSIVLKSSLSCLQLKSLALVCYVRLRIKT